MDGNTNTDATNTHADLIGMMLERRVTVATKSAYESVKKRLVAWLKEMNETNYINDKDEVLLPLSDSLVISFIGSNLKILMALINQLIQLV